MNGAQASVVAKLWRVVGSVSGPPGYWQSLRKDPFWNVTEVLQ
jgi:hypothetical protein